MRSARRKKRPGPNLTSEKGMTPESNVLVDEQKTFPFVVARAPQPCRTVGDWVKER